MHAANMIERAVFQTTFLEECPDKRTSKAEIGIKGNVAARVRALNPSINPKMIPLRTEAFSKHQTTRYAEMLIINPAKIAG